METPEFYQGSSGYYSAAQFTPEKHHSEPKPGDHFLIDDLLDFPNDDAMVTEGGNAFDNVTGTSTDSSTVTVVDSSCNSSFSGAEHHLPGNMDAQFSNDLCVPYDDLAELEWLSNVVEESFSSEDLQKLQLISGVKARTHEASENHKFQADNNRNNPIFNPEMTVPGKARSKRSRAAPCNWTSRLLVLSPTTTPAMSSESESDIVASGSGKKAGKSTQKKREARDNKLAMSGGDGRRCLHCATDKTPQWRTGPMGPKTLCNACGVRYKSGRLVPEYRPAASPTFVLTKHSNSHRKVLELRRQKDLHRAQQHQQQFLHHQNMMFDVSNGDDYLIHQHIGPDYRQLI
ncbi:hypothetical protein RJ639_043976 [Escallonia herrerae]|uniref:GATA transcription factor n=1 Tax=Escallonia herrerae TaxID=1293975 RepID=A0AA88WAG3_9ASTE|nr:hypothetical protein RJ639_043976 [Escallonia herrerae]